MKAKGTKPTAKQRDYITKCGYDSKKHRVVRDTIDVFEIINIDTGGKIPLPTRQ